LALFSRLLNFNKLLTIKIIAMEQNKNRGSQQGSQKSSQNQNRGQNQNVSSNQQGTGRGGSSRSGLGSDQDLGSQRSDRSSTQRSSTDIEERDYGSV
jgi:hypothetical protein